MIADKGAKMIPTSEDCQADRVVAEGENFCLATWHPQWGGYVGRCVVQFGRHTGGVGADGSASTGCFDVTNYHDGEFSFDPENPGDNEPTVYHYCSAEQIVDFGITILAAICRHQRNPRSGQLVAVDRAWRDKAVEALLALPTRQEPAPQSGNE